MSFVATECFHGIEFVVLPRISQTGGVPLQVADALPSLGWPHYSCRVCCVGRFLSVWSKGANAAGRIVLGGGGCYVVISTGFLWVGCFASHPAVVKKRIIES